jgi:hypothetical protein
MTGEVHFHKVDFTKCLASESAVIIVYTTILIDLPRISESWQVTRWFGGGGAGWGEFASLRVSFEM